LWVWQTHRQWHSAWWTKNCAISHPLLNEGAFIREYSKIRLLFNRHWNDLKEMCSICLIVEYSRMNVLSLSSGCEIAQFFVRYMKIRHAIIILWVWQAHRNAIIILWVRQTHRHAIIILWLILWVWQTHRHAIIMSRSGPCEKQHLREIPTPDFVRTLRQ